MGLYSSVCVVFAVDLGDLPGPFRQRIHDAAENDTSVEYMPINDGARALLFAPGSHRALLDEHEVTVDVLDVESLPRGKRNATLKPWRAALASFCRSNGVKPQEPRWLIVSDIS